MILTDDLYSCGWVEDRGYQKPSHFFRLVSTLPVFTVLHHQYSTLPVFTVLHHAPVYVDVDPVSYHTKGSTSWLRNLPWHCGLWPLVSFWGWGKLSFWGWVIFWVKLSLWGWVIFSVSDSIQTYKMKIKNLKMECEHSSNRAESLAVTHYCFLALTH